MIRITKFIIIYLITPLSVGLLLSLGANLFFCNGSNGHLTNLTIDLASILISAIFVSLILDKNQKIIWKETNNKIKTRIHRLINFYITIIRIWLNYSIDDVFPEEIDPNDLDLVTKTMVDFAKNVLLQNFDNRSKGDVKWNEIFEGVYDSKIKYIGIKHVEKIIDRLLTRYNDKISPELFSRLLDFDQSVDFVIMDYVTIPEFFNDPDFTDIYQNTWRDYTSRELKKALATTIAMYEILNNPKMND